MLELEPRKITALAALGCLVAIVTYLSENKQCPKCHRNTFRKLKDSDGRQCQNPSCGYREDRYGA